MKQQRVSAKDLFVLADDISRLAKKAGALSQSAPQVYLQSALSSVLEGAKSMAFTEALERHNEETTEAALPGLTALEQSGGAEGLGNAP